jgi:uncharacterized protein (DUF433 family)
MVALTRKYPFETIPLGIGYYTVPEAARLLKAKPRSITRWLGGYTYRSESGEEVKVPPLWAPELPAFEDHVELGFRDLIELRFVKAFVKAGLGLKAIRNCLDRARDYVSDDRPFSTRRFQTDGRTIFLDSLRQTGEAELLDLKKRQYVFRDAVEKTFRDLDISADVVSSWRPFQGKLSIIIDPKRAFGQPIAAEYNVPTVALAEAAEAEGSTERAAFLYEVPVSVVRDAVRFESYLRAA